MELPSLLLLANYETNLPPKIGIQGDDELYRAHRQDVAQEKERNEAAAKQSRVRQSNQVLLRFSLFPVRHPVYGPGSSVNESDSLKQRRRDW